MPLIPGRQAISVILLACLLASSLVIAIGALAGIQLQRIGETIDDLTGDLLVQKGLVEDIVKQVLLTRFYANRYVRTQSQADVDRFNAELARLMELLVQAEWRITTPERVEMIGRIAQDVGAYGEAFQEVTNLIRKRQRMQGEILDIQEHTIQDHLTALRVHSLFVNAPQVFLAFGNAQSALNSMSLNAGRYLELGDVKYAIRVGLSCQQAEVAFSELETALEDPVQRRNATQAKTLVDAYSQAFQTIRTDNARLQTLLRTMEGELEPRISIAASEIAASVAEEYTLQNQASQSMIAQAQFVLVLTALAAVLTGLVLGVVIMRRSAERARSEEVLRASEERYRTLFEGVPVGIYRVTPAGQLITANPALVEMLGYPDLESLSTVNTATHYADFRDYQRWVALLEDQGAVSDFETRFRRADGTVIWVQDNARAIKAGAGAMLFYEGVVEDITGRKQAEEALKASRDYLEESVEARTAELSEVNVQLRREITERLSAEEALRRMAIRDPLTDMFNRRHLFALGEREFKRARRYGHPLSVIILDLDHFKRVNDTYGHACGDQVLTQFASLCQLSLREIDVVARYGGEEFVILLPETDLASAALIAERLRTMVEEASLDTDAGALLITISLGMASTESNPSPRTLDDLLNRADQALYFSKEQGRNRVSTWPT